MQVRTRRRVHAQEPRRHRAAQGGVARRSEPRLASQQTHEAPHTPNRLLQRTRSSPPPLQSHAPRVPRPHRRRLWTPRHLTQRVRLPFSHSSRLGAMQPVTFPLVLFTRRQHHSRQHSLVPDSDGTFTAARSRCTCRCSRTCCFLASPVISAERRARPARRSALLGRSTPRCALLSATGLQPVASEATLVPASLLALQPASFLALQPEQGKKLAST
eukprot:4613475-Pleurochrysis_carterae.AAC.3